MFLEGKKLKEAFLKAKKNKYGIIASNVVFDFTVRGLLQGYDKMNSDGLLQMSAGACKFAAGNSKNMFIGADLISATIRSLSKQFKNSGVGLNIDHATPDYFDFIKYCIENKLVSCVMIDASKESFEDNVRITSEVVSLAHKHGVIVEGEIGYIKGTEDEIVSETELYTNPEEALEYVKKTGVDLFAASVGTNHGVTKGHKVHLKIDLIKTIDDLLIANNVETGLVLHGASGLTIEQQQSAVKNGVVKINKDTDYQIAMSKAVQSYWEKEKDSIVPPQGVSFDDFLPDKKRFDPRKWVEKAELAVQNEISSLVEIVSSKNNSIFL